MRGAILPCGICNTPPEEFEDIDYPDKGVALLYCCLRCGRPCGVPLDQWNSLQCGIEGLITATLARAKRAVIGKCHFADTLHEGPNDDDCAECGWAAKAVADTPPAKYMRCGKCGLDILSVQVQPPPIELMAAPTPPSEE